MLPPEDIRGLMALLANSSQEMPENSVPWPQGNPGLIGDRVRTEGGSEFPQPVEELTPWFPGGSALDQPSMNFGDTGTFNRNMAVGGGVTLMGLLAALLKGIPQAAMGGVLGGAGVADPAGVFGGGNIPA